MANKTYPQFVAAIPPITTRTLTDRIAVSSEGVSKSILLQDLGGMEGVAGRSLTVISDADGSVSEWSSLQAAYDWLKSTDRDADMGVLSIISPRYLLLSPGDYSGSLSLTTVDNVYVAEIVPDTTTNVVSDRLHVLTSVSGATICNTVSQIKAAVGYWSGSARVVGSADGGTVQILAGTYDFDETILYPDDDTTTVGAGLSNTIIKGRLFAKLTAAANTLTLEDIQIDINGNSAIPASDLPASSSQGGVVLEDGAFTLRRARITNSDTSDGLNNITVVEDDNITKCHMYNCEVYGSNADCVSAKVITGSATAGSVFKAYNCDFHTPATGVNDQAFTTHSDFPIYAIGCYISNPNTNYRAIAGGASTDLIYLFGCTIVGRVTTVGEMIGCYVDGTNASSDIVSGRTGDACYIVGNYIKSGVLDAGKATVTIGAGSAAEKSYVLSNVILGDADSTDLEAGVLVKSGSDVGDVFVNNNYIYNTYRGVDARECDNGLEINNNIIDVPTGGNFVILGISGTDSKANILPGINSVSTHTLDATDLNILAEIDKDYSPLPMGNCDKTGLVTTEIGDVVGYDIDLRGNQRKWKSVMGIGPVELPQEYTRYDRGGLRVSSNMANV